ncbi:MAG: DNA primase [Candidatus Doudnabacteria bacterium]|nr:DNA primase [Candidatus Doudnabacteria bacterium]
MLPSEEIKTRINIADLIGEYVQLKRAGVNFRAVCPFHQEKTPSFYVSPSKQIWHCFGCGLGGDIFEFVKQTEGVEFPEALQILAARAGVVLQKPTVSYQKEADQKKILLETNEWAAKYYEKVLADSSVAQNAREYLQKRGFRPETIKTWRLGYAPSEFHALDAFLSKKGYKRSEGVAAGLLVEKDGNFFDRFRERIMFPLFDIHGRVVGFTARILHDEEGVAKYVNSPETLIYSKSRLVYGLHLAKTEIRKNDQAIVVEGNADVITCHEAGFGNVIGSSGTALTASQLETLKRFTNNISFAFDVDEAGLLATRRAVELALSQGFNVRILSVPKALAKDPDELIRKDRALWEQAVADARPFLDFYFEAVFAKINLTSNMDKKQAVAELLPLISLLPDPIDRTHFVQKLSSQIGVDQKIILELLNKKSVSHKPNSFSSRRAGARPATRKSKQEILERQVLGFLLKFAKNLGSEWQDVSPQDFSVPALQEIFLNAKQQVVADKFDLSVFTADYPKLKEEVELLLFALENELSYLEDSNLEDLKRQFLGEFKLAAIRRQMQELALKIKTAESLGKHQEAQNLSVEFNELSQKLAQYHVR